MPDFTAQAPTLVNTTTAGDQTPPLIAGLANGGAVVTWFSAADQNVYVQQYDASGARAGGETLVANAAGGSVAGVTDVAGGFVVLFTQGGAGGASSVLAQRFDFAGHVVGAATVVASSTSGSTPVAGESIETLPDGGWLVTYEREYLPPSPIASATLYGQRFDANGTAVGGELTLAQASGSLETSTAVLPDGEWVTTYNQFANYHDGLVAYATQFASSGVAEHVTTINPNPDATEVAPQVAQLAGGQQVVVWFTPDQQATAFHLQAQLFDAAGAPLAASFDLADAQGALVGKDPQVTALVGGGFLVSWVHAQLVSQASSGPSTYSFDVRAQSFDATGHANGAPVQLEPARTVTGYVPPTFHWSVLATGDGGFVAAEERSSAATGLDVYLQKFSPAPAADAAPATTQHTGTAGDDRLTGSAGSDAFDGGAGTDTALLGIALADVQSYSITDGVLTIGSAGGTDTLRNMERVQFTDALFALDTQPGGHVWEAAALWHAAFGVLPGRADLSQWTAAADHSAGTGSVATQMIDHYAPGIASADLVTYLYQQLAHEQPSAQTVQSWVDQIGDGRTFATQGDLVAYAASLPLNTDGIAAIVGTIQPLDLGAF
jgi:hypothetical protein